MVRPLKMFMRGKNVAMLQRMLAQAGYSIDDRQGLFGASTRDAVRDFQKRRGLEVTGTVDQALFEQIRSCAGLPAPENRPAANRADDAPGDRLEALIGLLIDKGVITGEELDDALSGRKRPVRVTQPPLT